MDAGETAALIGTKLSSLAMWRPLVRRFEGTLIVSGSGTARPRSRTGDGPAVMSDEPLSIEAGDSNFELVAAEEPWRSAT